MTLSSAFSSALSGLAATTRQAAALSSNVANATTPGYAPRSVLLSARAVGGPGQGVQIDGIQRATDLVLTHDRRAAQAANGDSTTRSRFLTRLESIIGDSEDPSALGARIDALDTTLLAAASRPDSAARLTAVLNAALQLADGLNAAGDMIQAERMAADRAIAAGVDQLNNALRRVQDLNRQITALGSSGQDASALMDQRSAAIDSIASWIPLREVPRDGGQVALISTGGAVLLDGVAGRFGFTPTPTIVAEMTLAGGGLSGLTLNGRAVTGPGATGLMDGGQLAGLFALRDDLAPAGQARIDALARDLIDRFADPGVDSSLAPGMPGLFTDAGGALDPLAEVGLAGRITVNPAADPAAGGAIWRLRDGLGTLTEGASGNAALLVALSDSISHPRATGSASLAPGSRSLPGLAAEILSSVTLQRLAAEDDTAFTSAQLTALQDAEAARGVDIDAEMQALLVIAKNYAANARVIQVLDQMLATLLEM